MVDITIVDGVKINQHSHPWGVPPFPRAPIFFGLGQAKVCKTHLGTRNVDYRMKRYVFRRTVDGIHIIHLGKTWEKQLGKKNETDKPMA
jgi:hypothetical protein